VGKGGWGSLRRHSRVPERGRRRASWRASAAEGGRRKRKRRSKRRRRRWPPVPLPLLPPPRPPRSPLPPRARRPARRPRRRPLVRGQRRSTWRQRRDRSSRPCLCGRVAAVRASCCGCCCCSCCFRQRRRVGRRRRAARLRPWRHWGCCAASETCGGGAVGALGRSLLPSGGGEVWWEVSEVRVKKK
jgi:hypothetical protein